MKNKVTSIYSLSAKYLLYVLLLTSPLFRGSVLGWQQSIITVFALILLCILFAEQTFHKGCEWQTTSLDKPMIGLLVVVLGSSLFTRSSGATLEGISLLVTYLALFHATVNCIRTRYDQRELVYLICGSGLLVSFVGILKYAGLIPDIWTYNFQQSSTFMTSAYGNHNHFAGYLEMVIPFSLALLLTRTRRGLWKPFFIGIAFLLAVCHILSLSRGGWFSLAVALCFMTAFLLMNSTFRRKKLVLLIFSACSIVALFILSGSSLFERAFSLTDSETLVGMNGRVLVWKGMLPMIKDHLLTGTGPGTFSTIFPQYQLPGTTARFYQAHNDYLHFIAELGILFIPVLCWLLFQLFRTAIPKLHSDSRQTWGITLGALCGIIAILAHSFVDFNLHIPANAVLFTVLVAIVVGGPRKRAVSVPAKSMPCE